MVIDSMLVEYSVADIDRYPLVAKSATLSSVGGATFGLLIGGVLSYTDETGLTNVPMFDEMPFLLPSIVVTGVSVIAFLLMFIELSDPPRPE
jgi:hypothetical protein